MGPTLTFSALIIAVVITVSMGSIVRNQETFNFKKVENPEGTVLMRQSHPLQSVPMIPLHRSNNHQTLTVPAGQLDKNSACACKGRQCGCCIRLDVEAIGLDSTGCVNVTYLSKEIGFEFTLSVDGAVLIDQKISVSNPPPICAGIPELEKYASACVKFHDLSIQDKRFSGCVAVEVRFAGEVLVNYDLGCFHIPPTVDTRNLSPSDLVLVKALQARGVVQEHFLPGGHRLQTLEDLQSGDNSICSCKGHSCFCCIHMKSEKVIHINETGCVNVSYLPSELGIEFQLTLNGKPIIDEKISERNPPPLCAAVPYLHKLASVCIKFRDLQFKGRQFSGCAGITVMLAGVTIENFDLGCFHIPPKFQANLEKQVPQLRIN